MSSTSGVIKFPIKVSYYILHITPQTDPTLPLLVYLRCVPHLTICSQTKTCINSVSAVDCDSSLADKSYVDK